MTGAAVIGLIEPPGRITGGEIRLKGERIDNLPLSAMRKIRGKRIGMVFQDPLTSLNPLFRIGDQIVETMMVHLDLSAAEARRRAIELLGEVGIPAPEQRIDAFPHEPLQNFQGVSSSLGNPLLDSPIHTLDFASIGTTDLTSRFGQAQLNSPIAGEHPHHGLHGLDPFSHSSFTSYGVNKPSRPQGDMFSTQDLFPSRKQDTIIISLLSPGQKEAWCRVTYLGTLTRIRSVKKIRSGGLTTP